jgi:beta-glucanase (GH16 family)
MSLRKISLREDQRPMVSAPSASLLIGALRRGGGRAAVLALLFAMSVAVPSIAATTKVPTKVPTKVRTVTTTRHEKARTLGEYAIVVTIPTLAVSQSINVVAANQAQRDVAVGPAPVHLAFYVHITHHTYTVHTTSAGTPVHFTVAASLQPSASSGSTSTTGATGTTGTSGPGGVVDIGPPKGPYNTLVWSDEFNGPAGTAPNPLNWTADAGGGCGSGPGLGPESTNTQDLANASLNGAGDLAITALAGASGYTSAQLDSYGDFSYEYGRIEARIEEPAGVGLCSQFWLLGDDPTLGQDCWPGCGEIDVHEAIGNLPSQADAFLHGPGAAAPGYQQFDTAIESALPFTASFHTYGIVWQPNLITWTLDGVPYATATPATLGKGSTWAFNGHPFHVVLDLEVGGWPGPPNANTLFPASMLVDWVRVYQ